MIITLCGSARFESQFKLWNEVLSLSGHTVFSLAVYPSDKSGVKCWYDEHEKLMLDRVHKDKIAASDAILVLNRFGYVGESTISEIEFAQRRGKKIYALESWGKGHGIGAAHYNSVQRYVADKIPEYAGSPIDSSKFTYSYDLIHDGSIQRAHIYKLLDLIKEQEEAELKPYQ